MKVLDFGLAKAMAGDAATADPVNSPTLVVTLGNGLPKAKLRFLRGCISEAVFAITRSDFVRAVSSLDEALRELEGRQD